MTTKALYVCNLEGFRISSTNIMNKQANYSRCLEGMGVNGQMPPLTIIMVPLLAIASVIGLLFQKLNVMFFLKTSNVTYMMYNFTKKFLPHRKIV